MQGMVIIPTHMEYLQLIEVSKILLRATAIAMRHLAQELTSSQLRTRLSYLRVSLKDCNSLGLQLRGSLTTRKR